MIRLIKYIVFLMLAIAFWQTVSDTFTVSTADENKLVTEQAEIMYHNPIQDSAYFTNPQSSYHSDAELGGAGAQSQTLVSFKGSRTGATEYLISLKNCIAKLARRDGLLTLHQEKLYDATAFYRCQPVCEYYIITLRKILI